MFLRSVLLHKRAYGKVMFLKPFSLQRGLWKSYVLESLFFAKGLMEKLCSCSLFLCTGAYGKVMFLKPFLLKEEPSGSHACFRPFALKTILWHSSVLEAHGDK